MSINCKLIYKVYLEYYFFNRWIVDDSKKMDRRFSKWIYLKKKNEFNLLVIN